VALAWKEEELTFMLAKLGALLSVLGFPLLCLNCIGTDSKMIATMLQNIVSTNIMASPISGVDVKADGRDIILTGKVPSEEQKTKAGQLALLTPGVRTVDNELVVVGDAKAINVQISKILLDKKIEFQTNKDVLLPASIPVLKEVLTVLNQAPGLSIRVEGHTDNSGSASDNRVLSQKRAQAVVSWFSQNGIAASRMQAAGFGPDKPIAPNTTADGKAKNRRVEIITNN
jgi:outer membrane protein OmpA-like peptidoglycan-associated protein